MLAHLRRRWSLSGEIQRFSGNETSIFHCAGREETEANEGHRGDRTLDRTQSLFDRTRPVSAQCLRASWSSDRTRWRVRSRSTGRVRSCVEAYWKRPDAGTMASSSSIVRVRSLTRWSVARLDQRVRSITGPARPVALSRMGGVRICASGQFDQRVWSARLQQFQVPNG
jgi:hypothetical protein